MLTDDKENYHKIWKANCFEELRTDVNSWNDYGSDSIFNFYKLDWTMGYWLKYFAPLVLIIAFGRNVKVLVDNIQTKDPATFDWGAESGGLILTGIM